MTNHFSQALERAAREGALTHLGASDSLDRALELAFSANQDAITTELNLLRGNARVSVVAMWAGLALLVIGTLLVYSGNLGVGVASSAMGIVAEIISLLIFRRLEQSRQAIRSRLPSYSSLYALLVANEVGDAEIRSEMLKVLQDTLPEKGTARTSE